MTGIDGATAAWPTEGRLITTSSFDRPDLEMLMALSTEFFVEWQVADDDALARLTSSPET